MFVSVQKSDYPACTFLDSRIRMPPKHVAVVSRTADYFRRWAQEIGPETARQVENILQSHPNQEYGYRTIQGIKRLSEKGKEKLLEEACRLTNQHGDKGYRAVARRMALSVASEEKESSASVAAVTQHSNIRGAKYFH